MVYFPFIRAFEENVEKLLDDEGSKLARLMQLCTGKAARALQCCSMLPPAQGYRKARQILKARFGDPFMITEVWVDKLTEGGPCTSLQEYADDLQNCYECLTALGAASELQSQSSLVALVRNKLPPSLQNRWRDVAYKLKEKEGRRPELRDVVKFTGRAAAMAADPVYGAVGTRPGRPDRNPPKSSYATFAEVGCPICEEEGHEASLCPAFIMKNPGERLQAAMKVRLCFVCLCTGHITRDCPAKAPCKVRGCNRWHAVLLHKANWNQFRKENRRRRGAREPEPPSVPPSEHPQEPPSEAQEEHPVPEAHYSASFHVRGSKVALPLLPVRISSPETGKTVETYALLDSGSNVSLCQDRLLESLGATGRPETMELTTLEKASSQSRVRVLRLTVADPEGRETIELPRVYSRTDLHLSPDNLVSQEEVEQWPHLRDLPLHYATVEEVTLLIGQDCPEALIPLTTVSGARGEPYAVRTHLGWTVNGPVSRRKKTPLSCHNALGESRERLAQLHEKVDRFCRLESTGVFEQEKGMSASDRAVLARWKGEVTYEDGHYTLPIPFKEAQPRLPDNLEMAKRRLVSLARKLRREQKLHVQYTAGMQDLVNKGYAARVPEEEVDRRDGHVWYLPHHPVINPNKDKPRIVFDCAAEHRGTSLNDRVHQGPYLTNKLIGVLLRFRLHPVAIMADIEAMFHQVKVVRQDQDVLRFLWWPEGNLEEDPVRYQMTVHLFGGTWSPSCCTYALHRTAEDHARGSSSVAKDAVLSNFYVDDCLKSVPTSKEAILLAKQPKEFVAQGGFNLTKWTSNSRDVLEHIPLEDQSKRVKEHVLDEPLEDRALGVYWSLEEDELGFKVQEMAKPLTKRGILSMLSSVYNPLGIASPFVLGTRKVMQELCRTKLGWDDQVPPVYQQQWQRWTQGLHEMAKIRVPRCLQPVGAIKRQLHHFADASETAYGVVSYLRIQGSDGCVASTLVMAKSRLAPLKKMTIPRLELQAATLATRQDALLRRELGVDLARSQYWTDSTIVLQYISNTEARYHTFVAN